MADLTGKQYQALAEALLDAFRTTKALEFMVRVELGQRLDDYTEGPRQTRVTMLIDHAEERGITGELVAGAHRSNPGNERLREFHDGYFASIQRAAPSPVLEKIVTRTSAFRDIARWRA